MVEIDGGAVDLLAYVLKYLQILLFFLFIVKGTTENDIVFSYFLVNLLLFCMHLISKNNSKNKFTRFDY